MARTIKLACTVKYNHALLSEHPLYIFLFMTLSFKSTQIVHHKIESI